MIIQETAMTLTAFAMMAAAVAAPAFQASVSDAPGGRFTPAQYANVYGCTGSNHSPHISWSGAPADTQSYAITIFDPDAPTGHGWWHWLIVDIPASSNSLSSDALPAGVTETPTDFGKPGYGGPCPPQGQDHRYQITVYALKAAKITLPADRSPLAVEAAIKAQSLTSAQVVLRASR
jgi:Raf kinase inhibitor-like YbhB/YbcL family protein